MSAEIRDRVSNAEERGGAVHSGQDRDETQRPPSGLHLRRYREVSGVLVRYGLGALIGRRSLRHPLHPPANDATEASGAVRLRRALEELGVTFIKLGQILSTRADLLPPAYQAELARLQDHGPTIPTDVIRHVIESELGETIEQLFASFDDAPLATGSIGQAHAATLHDGTAVVVKVRRPGAVEQVNEDLAILELLAHAAARHWSAAARYDLVGIVQQFAETLRAELDYVQEARSAVRYAQNFRGEPALHVPRVFPDRSTARVLTLERISGIKIDAIDALAAAKIDVRTLAQSLARISLTAVLDDGFFHADPHPGNFFIEETGRIGIIDFGMMGSLSQHTRTALIDLTIAAASDDADAIADCLQDLGVAGESRHGALAGDVERLLIRYHDRALGEIAIGQLLADVLAVIRARRLVLPANLALLVKTVTMIEGLCVRLDPAFRLAALFEQSARRLVQQRYGPRRLLRRWLLGSAGTARLIEEFPPVARRLLREIDAHGLEVSLRQESVEPLVSRLEQLANRLVLGIIVSAFIVGLAILMAGYHPSGWARLADAALACGLIVAVAVGAYLAWTILRSGRA